MFALVTAIFIYFTVNILKPADRLIQALQKEAIQLGKDLVPANEKVFEQAISLKC